jgi:SGNH domain (fused to AT3 domains)/Acyltransferase family
VYPTLFLIVASVQGRLSLRARLSIALGFIIVASYWLSIVQTASNPSGAYFSPLTRAWELALGALVAVGTFWLKQIPRQAAAVLTWAGLAAILVAAFVFNAQTAYPGSLVAVPVIGSALIIAGGVAVPRYGAESLLSLHPFQWLGRRSYSLYLWHWPILIIAAERVGKSTLSLGQNLGLLVIAMLISMASYSFIENPIRHRRFPSKRTVAAGVVMVVVTVLALTLVISTETVSASSTPVKAAPSDQVVAARVAAAIRITSVPKSIQPPISQAATDKGRAYNGFSCTAKDHQSSVSICPLGDPNGKRLLVLYGDSHALMWIPAFETIALAAHWRLVVLAKPDCPAALVSVSNPWRWRLTGQFASCDQWHQWAVRWINSHKPNVLVASQSSRAGIPFSPSTNAKFVTSSTWQQGYEALFNAVTVPGIRKDLLGGTPIGLDHSVGNQPPGLGPVCLSAHPQDVQQCSVATAAGIPPSYQRAEQTAAQNTGAEFIDPLPWFCSSRCTSIVGHYIVYADMNHITATYAQYLQTVLGRALALNGR